MSKDFRIKQLRASQIIGSGSNVGTVPSILVYSASAALGVDGAYNADLLRNVGTDVWYFVSGSKHSISGSQRQDTVLFGGDVVVSGTLFAERQVIQVDWSQSSDLLLSGAIVLADQGAGTDLGRPRLDEFIANLSGSLFMATGSLYLAAQASGVYTETSMTPINYSAGNGIARQPISNAERSLNLDINGLSGSLTNSSIAAGDLFAVADIDAAQDESKKITFVNVATKLAGAGLTQAAGVVTLDAASLASADIDSANDRFIFHDVSGTPATKQATLGSLVFALTGSGVGSSSGKLISDINTLTVDGNAGNLSDSIALADASAANVTKKITITQLKALVDTNTTYTAGAGLDLGGTEFSLDLKSAGGLKIDSTELAIDDSKVATISGSDFSGVVIASNSLTASLGLHVAEYIRHVGDEDTNIRFDNDLIQFTAGAIPAIDILENGASSAVIINDTSNANLDFKVKSVNKPKILNVNAGLDYVSIGDDALIKEDMHLFVSGWNGGAADAVATGVSVFHGDVVVSGSLLDGAHTPINKTSIAQNGTFGAGSANVPTASGTDAVAIGLRATASGNYSLAIGSSENNNTDATAAHSLAIGGDDATASATYASAIGGKTNTATGQYSIAMGRNSNAGGDYSVAIGDTLTTYDGRTTIFGSSGSPASAKTLLSSSLEVNQAATFHSTVDVDEKIRHKGDDDTYIRFDTNRIRGYTGDVQMVDLSHAAVNNRHVKFMEQGNLASGVAEHAGNDVSFYVSGTVGNVDSKTIKGTALFGGDITVSGSINTPSNISTSGSLIFDLNTSIVRDGNDLKFDDGNNTVKTLTQLATTMGPTTFHLGVHGGSNDSKMASSASISFAGRQGADHYVENIGADVYMYVSGGVRHDEADYGRTTAVFGGAVVLSGAVDFLDTTSFAAGITVPSMTGSQSVTTPRIADGDGDLAMLLGAQKLSIGPAALTPVAANATLTINKNTATQAGTGNVNSEFQILLKNLDDGDNSFSGIAFDSGNETDPDSIGAAIRSERDSTAGSNMALHDTNLTFATNDAGDGGLTERMRITHDGKVQIAGGTLAFGNGQNAAIAVSDVSGTDTAGKTLSILGGASTGTGAGGQIEFKVTPPAGSTGAGVNSHVTLLTLPSTGIATFAGSIQIPNGESIKNGAGENVITIDADQNATVLGDLQVSGNDIKDAGGNTALTFDGTSGNITNAITFSGTQIPVFSGNNGVKFANDLIHDGDTDTKIRFFDNKLSFEAGGLAAALIDGNSAQKAVVFNESSADIDFRVESNNEDHMFFVDGATDRIGIGIAAPSTTVEIKGATADQTTLQLKDSASSDVIVKMYHLDGEDDGIIDVLANNVVTARINSNGVSMLGGDGGSAAAEPGLLIVRRDSSTAANDLLGVIGFDSSDGNVPSSVLEASAYIAAYASENHSTSAKGGRIGIGLSRFGEDDDTVSTEIIRIDELGLSSIGSVVSTESIAKRVSTGYSEQDQFIKIASCVFPTNTQATATATMLVTLTGRKGSGELNASGQPKVALLNVCNESDGTAAPIMTVDFLHSDGELVDPEWLPGNFLLTYNTGAKTAEIWVQAPSSGGTYDDDEMFVSILGGGNSSSPGNYDGFWTVLGGEDWAASVTSLGTDVVATLPKRQFGQLAITAETSTVAALLVAGNSNSANPIVKFVSNDTAMATNQTLLEINSADTSMGSDNFWVEFTQGAGSTVVGSINSEVAYTTFTGQHPTKLLNNQIPAEGSILKSTGTVLYRDGISNAWVETTATTVAKDKAIVGVYRGTWTDNGPISGQLHVYNAIGEGQLLVTDSGGNIEVGDYICSSTRTGHGMKQDDDLLHNYTVAKVTEAINWNDIEIDSDLGFKSSLIACTYHSG